MRADILIVGQGLAGTLLAWMCERAGLAFAIADAGKPAATRVAAGILNPITGRRLVKSWRVDTLLPRARETYRELEAELRVTLWRELRVRRLFVDARERRVFAEKQARGELAPFVGAADDEGCWVEGAARVDLPGLVDAARERWRKQDRFVASEISPFAETARHELVIDCTGAAGARGEGFSFVPWEFSKGETLLLAVDGLASDVVLNRGHWVLPLGPGVACVGATHDPRDPTSAPTAAARTALEASARALLARPFTVTGHEVGVRVNLPDKHPIAGRHPENARYGLINGLGAKGALVAPWLARQWVDHLTTGAAFDAEISAGRFFGHHSSQAWSR